MSASTAFWLFLRKSKAAFSALTKLPPSQLHSARMCHFVLGNEAGDADSCISSLVWSFYLSTLPPGSLRAGDSDLFPVVSCAAADINLRREFTYLLQQNLAASGSSRSVDEIAADLIFADQLPLHMLEGLHGSGRLAFTLTDHNVLGGRFAALGDAVVACVDHHHDSGAHPVRAFGCSVIFTPLVYGALRSWGPRFSFVLPLLIAECHRLPAPNRIYRLDEQRYRISMHSCGRSAAGYRMGRWRRSACRWGATDLDSSSTPRRRPGKCVVGSRASRHSQPRSRGGQGHPAGC
jgi:hypothetical protein